MTISLTDGVHCMTEVAIVMNLENLTISGENSSSAVITCTSGVGLAFINISNLQLNNLEVRECGLVGENLDEAVNITQKMITQFFGVANGTQVAVFISNILDLNMDGIVITNTTGLGLVGINILGSSNITNCEFSYNRQQYQSCAFPNMSELTMNVGERIGGGAYFLYQDTIDSDPTKCDPYPLHSLDITDCSFLSNSECSIASIIEITYRNSLDAQSVGYIIGGGGGMSVVFAQACYGINVTTSHTVFQGNTATYGSGAKVGISQQVAFSYAIFDNCLFTDNGYLSNEFSIEFPSHGGALTVVNDIINPNPDNVFFFSMNREVGMVARNSNFTNNGAIDGGAVAIISLATTSLAIISENANFLFDNCIFSGNRATRGAAIFLVETKLSAMIPGIAVSMKDVTITENNLAQLGSLASPSSADSAAIFEARSVNITLYGECAFTDNIGSGLLGINSIIGIAGDVSISNNTALYGGGITLRISFIIMLPNSSLDISNNVARIYGGGLYVNQLIDSPLPITSDCFLYFNYEQFNFCQDCDFTNQKFFVRLANNTAMRAGTIFGSALVTCPWSQSLQLTFDNTNVLDILNTHFSDYFHITPDPIGIDNVRTPVSKVSIEDQEAEYEVAPGEILDLLIRPEDNLGQSVATIIGVYADLDQAISQDFLPTFGGVSPISGYNADSNSSTPLVLLGEQNITASLVVYSLDVGYRPVQIRLVVTLQECPFGFTYDAEIRQCVCSDELLKRGVVCDSTNLTVTIPSGVWVGPVDSERFGVGNCIRGLCVPGETNLSVKNDPDYDAQCRPDLNRGGVLCGSCREGYSHVFGSPRCIKCTNASVPIIFLFLVLGGLIIAFLVIFPVNISSGYLNGILFWANIVDLYDRILEPSGVKSKTTVGVLANWITLNWGIETCFHVGMSPLEQSWWELSFPIYLFILMLIVRGVFKLKCCRVRSKTAFATIEAFATLLIMCYVSILQSSFQLIGTARIDTDDDERSIRWVGDPTLRYFRGSHGFVAFVATLYIIFYVIPIPIILLFPTLLYSNRCLKRYKPFYDALWNPFKPKFRFWLGLRLIFRWGPFIVASFAPPPMSTFVTAFFLVVLLYVQLQFQPFQSKIVNTIDSLLLVNLVLLFIGSLYFNATLAHSQTPEAGVLKKATNYTIALVVAAYILILLVFAYRVYVRIPKLRIYFEMIYAKCCKKKMKKIVLHVPQSITEEDTQCSYTNSNFLQNNKDPVSPRVVGHTSFRESLLDEGSVEIHTYTTALPPSTKSNSPTTTTPTTPSTT